MKIKWVTVQFMKLDIFFDDFNVTVSYRSSNGSISVLNAYDNKTSQRISVTTEMFEAIEEAVKNIIRYIN